MVRFLMSDEKFIKFMKRSNILEPGCFPVIFVILLLKALRHDCVKTNKQTTTTTTTTKTTKN